MLSEITFYQILGLPMVAWGGITAIILLVVSAILGKMPKYRSAHITLATISIILALIHGALGLLSYL